MSNERARITIKAGEREIEIEGTEKYVEAKLEDPSCFDELLSKVGIAKPKSQTAEKEGEKKTRKKRGGRKNGYQIVKELDLSGSGNKKSLKNFYEKKQPSSNFEKNVVFVFYLTKIAKISNVNRNHVYTCYKDVGKGKGALGNLIQSLRDTSHHKGWIDTSNMDDLKVTKIGENFVKGDLPQTKKSK